MWSGGYPREIVRLLRLAVRDAPLDADGFERLIGQAGDDYRRLLRGDDLELLTRVAVEHDLLPDGDAEEQAADRLFANNVILRYQNHREWYDVHPAVREVPRLKEAIARLASSRGQT